MFVDFKIRNFTFKQFWGKTYDIFAIIFMVFLDLA